MPRLPAANSGDDALGVVEAESKELADGRFRRRIDPAEVEFKAAFGG